MKFCVERALNCRTVITSEAMNEKTYCLDKLSAIERHTSPYEAPCHLSIDFHFNINDRKVESTDKHESEAGDGVDKKNNCVLFK